MDTLGALLSIIKTVEGLLSKVLGKRGIRITYKIEAVTAMQRAINATETYLAKSKKQIEPNSQLADLWLTAFEKMLRIDKPLARKLRHTSNFWSNPEKWTNEQSAMELLPDLKDLYEQCEQILIELERRK